MKVLLTTINSKYIHQNLAIRLLYELNKVHTGLNVREFNLKDNPDEIADYCSKFELVAFSCYIWNITQTLDIAKRIKQRNASCKILLGGPEVSYEWKDIIALPEVDFIILGEGEIPFTSFLKEFPDFGKVPSLVWKIGEDVVQNHLSESINLQLLQNINPYQSIAAEELNTKISYIEASRGCPNCCEFCLAGLDNKLRFFRMETIQSNLLYLMEHGKTIKFLDRTFNARPDFAISILRFILENHKPGNIFQFEIKADIIQPEFIDFIKQNVPKGLFRFEIGIQTLNSRSNQEVKRRQNFENIKTFVNAVSAKVEMHLDLIVGLPHDYFADIKYSFEEVFKLFAPELQLGFLKFLKGTPIRNNSEKHHYKFDPLPPYQIIESKYLGKTELENIEAVEQTLDIYWNRKRALQTLKYIALNYSIFDFLLGLSLFQKQRTNMASDGLIEIYLTLQEFAVQHYPSDQILQELIALDYYTSYKVKPGTRFLQEIGNEERNAIVEKQKLNLHKYRYAIHQVNFSVDELVKNDRVKPMPDLLIIEYTGTDKPTIVLPDKNVS